MIAARRRDDALDLRPLALEPIEIDDAAAHLEGASGRVVLVLDHDIDTSALTQQRPGELRRRRHRSVDDYPYGGEQPEMPE